MGEHEPVHGEKPNRLFRKLRSNKAAKRAKLDADVSKAAIDPNTGAFRTEDVNTIGWVIGANWRRAGERHLLTPSGTSIRKSLERIRANKWEELLGRTTPSRHKGRRHKI